MFVCLFRIAGQTAGPIETKLDTRTHATQGVFLARSMSRSFTYACGSDRKPGKTARQRHLANAAHTTSGRLAEATPSERLRNAVELPFDYRGEAPKAPSSERRSASRTPSGGRVIRASYLYNKRRYVCLFVPYGRPNGWADRDET